MEKGESPILMVFRNRYVLKRILSLVAQSNIKYLQGVKDVSPSFDHVIDKTKSYKSINSVDWMLDNRHYELLAEKVRLSGDSLHYTTNSIQKLCISGNYKVFKLIVEKNERVLGDIAKCYLYAAAASNKPENYEIFNHLYQMVLERGITNTMKDQVIGETFNNTFKLVEHTSPLHITNIHILALREVINQTIILDINKTHLYSKRKRSLLRHRLHLEEDEMIEESEQEYQQKLIEMVGSQIPEGEAILDFLFIYNSASIIDRMTKQSIIYLGKRFKSKGIVQVATSSILSKIGDDFQIVKEFIESKSMGITQTEFVKYATLATFKATEPRLQLLDYVYECKGDFETFSNRSTDMVEPYDVILERVKKLHPKEGNDENIKWELVYIYKLMQLSFSTRPKMIKLFQLGNDELTRFLLTDILIHHSKYEIIDYLISAKVELKHVIFAYELGYNVTNAAVNQCQDLKILRYLIGKKGGEIIAELMISNIAKMYFNNNVENNNNNNDNNDNDSNENKMYIFEFLEMVPIETRPYTILAALKVAVERNSFDLFDMLYHAHTHHAYRFNASSARDCRFFSEHVLKLKEVVKHFSQKDIYALLSYSLLTGRLESAKHLSKLHPEQVYVKSTLMDDALGGGHIQSLDWALENRMEKFSKDAWRLVGMVGDIYYFDVVVARSTTANLHDMISNVYQSNNHVLLKYLIEKKHHQLNFIYMKKIIPYSYIEILDLYLKPGNRVDEDIDDAVFWKKLLNACCVDRHQLVSEYRFLTKDVLKRLTDTIPPKFIYENSPKFLVEEIERLDLLRPVTPTTWISSKLSKLFKKK